MGILQGEQRRFPAWLRTGRAPGRAVNSVERKFNPYHDPANGQFTFGPGSADGGRAYRGMTARGLGLVRPVSGGGTNREGPPLPEQFAPDPYALHTPAAALAHYVGGSGEDRNYYFSKVDTSHVGLADFPQLAKLAAEGKPGTHQVIGAAGRYDGGTFGKTQNATSAATVGGMVLRANGALEIARDGSYKFDGRISADPDKYDFNPRSGRSAIGDASTRIGRQMPGKPFLIHLIGSKPFKARGRR